MWLLHTGKEIAGVLQRHPKLLTFSTVGKGALENGRMRAEAGRDDAGRVWVRFFGHPVSSDHCNY